MNQSKAKRAAVGAVFGVLGNMALNSTFTIMLMAFIVEWPEAGIANIALAATFGCLFACLESLFLVGPVLKKVAPKYIFLFCTVLCIAYCLLHRYASSVIMLIIAGMLGGTTLAFGTHSMGVAAISPYFGAYGKKAGTTVAIVLAAANLGAVIMSLVVSNTYGRGSIDWRNTYWVIMAVAAIPSFLAFLIIPKPDKAESGVAGAAAGAATEAPGLEKGQVLKTGAFWLMFLGIAFYSLAYQGVCTYMITFMSACGLSASAASSMQAVMQAFGIIFVAFGAIICKKLGLKGLIPFVGIPLAIGILLLALVFPGTPVIWLAIVCAILIVVGAMVLNIPPIMAPELFGPKSLNQINPIITGGAFWGGTTLASQVVGRVITSTGSYPKGFIVAAIIAVAGMVLLFLALASNPSKKKG